jgi:hypothetical protein
MIVLFLHHLVKVLGSPDFYFFLFCKIQVSSTVCKFQCCGSGMFIPNPGSRIKKQQWKTGVKKNKLSYLFFGAIHFTKLNYFIFEMLKKKIWANFPRIIELLPKKLSLSSREPGSGKNLFWIPDPGVQKAPDPGSGSATLVNSTSGQGGDGLVPPPPPQLTGCRCSPTVAGSPGHGPGHAAAGHPHQVRDYRSFIFRVADPDPDRIG